MLRRRILAAVLTAAFCTIPAAAQSLDQLNSEAQEAVKAKDYRRAGDILMKIFERDNHAPGAAYNAACFHALAGDKEKALAALKLAADAGYLNAQGAAKDSDLASLHGDPRFESLIRQMQDRQAFESKLFDSSALATPYRENISEDEKLAGLSKFWSEVKYNFVYVDTLKAIDWDRLYLDYIPKVRATRSTAEYYKVLMELCARLKDGHTNVWPAPEAGDAFLARPKLKAQLVEGRVLVRQVFDQELVAKGVVPGTEVILVDGRPVKEHAMRELAPYVSASTQQDLEQRIYNYLFLAGPGGTAPQVSFRTAAGKTIEAPVRRVPDAEYGKGRPGTPPFELKILPGNIAWVALNEFGDSKAADGFMAAFDQIAAASALIIDVRNNGGGNSNVGYRVLATLTDQPFQTSRWETRNYRPSYRAWQRAMPNFGQMEPAFRADSQHAYRKPVAVLSAGGTYSAAEDFLVAFDSMKRGLIVGEPSGGSTGQPLFFKLPGGGTARICTKADTYPDGRQWVGKGIQPTLPVAPTVADVQQGRDTVLEAAVTALKKQI
jgi:C-terminal processing protease CtpA/Prc